MKQKRFFLKKSINLIKFSQANQEKREKIVVTNIRSK